MIFLAIIIISDLKNRFVVLSPSPQNPVKKCQHLTNPQPPPVIKCQTLADPPLPPSWLT